MPFTIVFQTFAYLIIRLAMNGIGGELFLRRLKYRLSTERKRFKEAKIFGLSFLAGF